MADGDKHTSLFGADYHGKSIYSVGLEKVKNKLGVN
jgi:hypothetical protein